MKSIPTILIIFGLAFTMYFMFFINQASKKSEWSCTENYIDFSYLPNKSESNVPPLYIITPTYKRAEQLADLTRLGYTLKHVKNLVWLVIEDAHEHSTQVRKILNRIGINFEHLIAPMPDEYKNTTKAKPRGVSNRNCGLQWIRNKYKNDSDVNQSKGALYFADDDNTYDIEIFEQIRYIKKIGMWPVGLVTKFGISSPIIDENNKLIGFYDGWIGKRRYPIDMAGFAISVDLLLKRPNAKMPFKPGYEEDGFILSLNPIKLSDIELLANNCTEILTWHTQTKKNPSAQNLDMQKYNTTNLVKLHEMLVKT